MISLPANVRDLGGLPLVDGGVTRSGVLVRGDALYAGDGTPHGLGWPPAAVIDLRSSGERNRSRHAWPSRTVVHDHDLFGSGDLSQLPANTDLLDVYRRMLAHAQAGIAAVVDLVPDAGPTYLHCAAGKDRTGTVVAALLLLAGVDEEAIIVDYRRTEDNMERVLERLVAQGAISLDGWDPAWGKAPEEAVKLVIDEVGTGPDARQWFLAHGASAAAIDRWRARLTGN